MTKTFEFPGLPRGMGACLGAFVRNSWMLLYQRNTIIGFSLNDLNPLDCIPETTTLMADVTLKLATLPYRVDMDKLVDGHQVRKAIVDDMPIYEVTIFKQTDCLTTDDLAPYVMFEQQDVLVKTLYPMEFNIRLYIKPTMSYVTEEINKSYLIESALGCDSVIAMATNNRTSANVYCRIEDYEVVEDLTIVFEGPDYYYDDFVKIVQSLGPNFLAKIQ